jgi:hypothetical protein
MTGSVTIGGLPLTILGRTAEDVDEAFTDGGRR